MFGLKFSLYIIITIISPICFAHCMPMVTTIYLIAAKLMVQFVSPALRKWAAAVWYVIILEKTPGEIADALPIN